MNNIQKYPAYKDSGVEWLGEIPEHWEVRKGKWLFVNQERPVRKTDGIITCFRDGEVTLRTNRKTDGFTIALREHGYQGIRKGDLVILNMDAFAGAIGVSDSDGKSTPVYSACTPRTNDKVDVYYYSYFLRHLAKSGFIESLAKGIRERSTDFRFNDFGLLLLSVPPIEEQTAIANFLDRQTAQIDNAITIKQKQIELLKERRQILIHRAVTRGIGSLSGAETPDVKLKDSGVEWIGEIPEGWEVVPMIKYASRVDYRGKTPEKVDSGIILVTTKNIKGGRIDYDISKEFVLEKDYAAIMSRGLPKIGDILFTMEAPLGMAAVVDNTDVAIAQRIIKFHFDDKVFNSYFVNQSIQSEYFQKILQREATGSTAQGIKASKLHKLKIIKPPLKEQIEIVSAIENISSKISTAITLKEKEIEKLREYKSVLINEAVSGKIKIG